MPRRLLSSLGLGLAPPEGEGSCWMEGPWGVGFCGAGGARIGMTLCGVLERIHRVGGDDCSTDDHLIV